MADKIEGSVIPVDAGFLNYLERELIGVVGQIVPWNFPLMFVSWKLGPALAAGNTVVMKPSEITPLSTLRAAELAQQVGIPDGVSNVVTGYAHTAGARIAEHPEIGKISFTGSTGTGRQIVHASAGNLKKYIESWVARAPMSCLKMPLSRQPSVDPPSVFSIIKDKPALRPHALFSMKKSPMNSLTVLSLLRAPLNWETR